LSVVQGVIGIAIFEVGGRTIRKVNVVRLVGVDGFGVRFDGLCKFASLECGCDEKFE
jgi:hypothetical protein